MICSCELRVCHGHQNAHVPSLSFVQVDPSGSEVAATGLYFQVEVAATEFGIVMPALLGKAVRCIRAPGAAWH
jgi:hypothetical protein